MMAHHSSEHDEAISKQMQEVFRKMPSTADPSELFRRSHLGATGDFPDGKIAPSDEGALAFSVGAKDGNVVLEFNTPVAWFGMTPDQAISLAELLIEKAARLGSIRPVKVRA